MKYVTTFRLTPVFLIFNCIAGYSWWLVLLFIGLDIVFGSTKRS